MKRRSIVLCLLISGMLAGGAHAHPVSYQNALSIMTWNQEYLTDYWATYSFRWNAAVAARYMRMDMKDGEEMRAYLPQADFLLYRRNAAAYQANIYAYGGYGGMTTAGRDGGTGLLGIELDAEDLKYYSALNFQTLLPSFGPNVYQTTARLGMSAYPAEFNELATWAILQYQSNPQFIRRQEVTPLLRFMYRNVLAETGVGVMHGDWLLNFMVHF